MTAFVISRTKVRDPAKMKEYGQAAAPTVAAHGGKVVLRGGIAKTLLGEVYEYGTGIMEFPDMQAIDAWFASSDYQALTTLREEACEMQLLACHAPAA